MTLPVSRNTNYSAGATAVKAADLNDVQDAIVGHKHPPIPLNLSGASMVPTSSAAVTYNSNGAIQITSAGGSIVGTLPLSVGDRITSVTFAVLGNGTVDFTLIQVSRVAPDQTVTVLGQTTVTNAPAAWTDMPLGLTPTVVSPGDAIVLLMTANGVVAGINNIRVSRDRL